MSNTKQLTPDERLVKIETKVDFMEKEQDKQGKAMTIMDTKIEKMAEFEIRVGIAVEQLGETTRNIEKALNNYITKQETKEEETMKAELQGKDVTIAKWQKISFEIGKWALIVLGADKVFFGGDLLNGIQKILG